MMSSNRPSESCAILYVRRSTGDQHGSLTQQVEWAIDHAKRMNISLNVTPKDLKEAIDSECTEYGDLYVDDAVTGADPEREGLLALLHRVKTDPGVTDVLVYSRDRLSRELDSEDATKREKLIRRSGKYLHIHDEILKPLSANDGDMFSTITAALAYGASGKYRTDLARNVLRGQRSKAEKGYSTGGRAPYGFVRALMNENTKKIEQILVDGERTKRPGFEVVWIPGPDEESRQKLAVVRRIAKDYFREDGGLNKIARRLNDEGIPSPNAGQYRGGRKNSGKWLPATVRNILENPAYISKVAWGRTSEGTVYRFDKEADHGLRDATEHDRLNARKGRKEYKRDQDEWLMADPPSPFEQIVPEQIWQANYEKLKERGEEFGTRGVSKSKDSNSQKYPLPVFCGNCGERMSGTQKRDKRKHGAVTKYEYNCRTYKTTQGKKCQHNKVDRDIAIAVAMHLIREKLKSLSNREALKNAIRKVLQKQKPLVEGADARERKKLEEKYEDLRRQRKEAYADSMRASDEDLRADAKEFYEQVNKDCKRIQKQISDHDKDSLEIGDIDAEADIILGLLDELHLFIEDVPFDRLRETFLALGAQLTIHFEKQRRKGRDLNIPVRGELKLTGSGIDLTAEKSAKKTFRKKKKKRSRGREVDSLPKGNRGERI